MPRAVLVTWAAAGGVGRTAVVVSRPRGGRAEVARRALAASSMAADLPGYPTHLCRLAPAEVSVDGRPYRVQFDGDARHADLRLEAKP